MAERLPQYDLRILLAIRKERTILRRAKRIARRIQRDTQRLMNDHRDRPSAGA